MPRNEPRPIQHHRKLAVVTLAGLFLALVVAVTGLTLPPGETPWHLLAMPEEDGGWRFVAIDGVDVREEGYSVGIRWSEITGFDDGCNSCGFSDDKPAGSTNRLMTCTLAGCAPRPHDALFARFVHGSPAMHATGDRLILTLPGHRAELLRAPRR